MHNSSLASKLSTSKVKWTYEKINDKEYTAGVVKFSFSHIIVLIASRIASTLSIELSFK